MSIRDSLNSAVMIGIDEDDEELDVSGERAATSAMGIAVRMAADNKKVAELEEAAGVYLDLSRAGDRKNIGVVPDQFKDVQVIDTQEQIESVRSVIKSGAVFYINPMLIVGAHCDHDRAMEGIPAIDDILENGLKEQGQKETGSVVLNKEGKLELLRGWRRKYAVASISYYFRAEVFLAESMLGTSAYEYMVSENALDKKAPSIYAQYAQARKMLTSGKYKNAERMSKLLGKNRAWYSTMDGLVEKVPEDLVGCLGDGGMCLLTAPMFRSFGDIMKGMGASDRISLIRGFKEEIESIKEVVGSFEGLDAGSKRKTRKRLVQMLERGKTKGVGSTRLEVRVFDGKRYLEVEGLSQEDSEKVAKYIERLRGGSESALS